MKYLLQFYICFSVVSFLLLITMPQIESVAKKKDLFSIIVLVWSPRATSGDGLLTAQGATWWEPESLRAHLTGFSSRPILQLTHCYSSDRMNSLICSWSRDSLNIPAGSPLTSSSRGANINMREHHTSTTAVLTIFSPCAFHKDILV